MKARRQTDWLEVMAGFLLLTAAAAMCLASAAPKIEVFGILAAANAAFASHLAARRRLARFALAAAGAFGFFYVAARWFDGGDGLAAVFVAVFGSGFLGRMLMELRDAKAGRAAADLRRPHLAIWGCAFLAASLAGFLFAFRIIPPPVGGFRLTAYGLPWPVFAVLSAVLGSLIVLLERSAGAWKKIAAMSAAAAGIGALAVGAFAAGSSESGTVFAAAAALLIMSGLFTNLHLVPEAEQELTDRQREVVVYNRIGEIAVWLITTISALHVLFLPGANFAVYFVALFIAAVTATVNNHLIGIAKPRPASYFTATYVLIAALLLVTHATGGLESPFVYFAFTAIFAGSVVVPSGRVASIIALLIAYFSIEFALLASFGYPDLVGRFHRLLFLSTAVFITGAYTAMIGRKREAVERELREANARLEQSLREVERERKAAEERSVEAKKLNEDLLEVRAALMNVLEDVEESKRELEQDHRRDSAIFQALGEGLAAADRRGRVFLCNPAAAAILGVDVRQVVGGAFDQVLQFFPEEGDVLQTEPFISAFEGRGGKLPDKLTLMRSDGRRVPVAGVIAPFMDETGRPGGVVLAFRDTGAEHELERQKSNFIAIASHQLRTPLSTLRWFLDLFLGGDAGRIVKRQREFLSDMLSSVVRMSKLVDDLLSVSGVESGKLKVNFASVKVEDLVRQAVKAHQPLIEERRQKFSVNVGTGLPNVRIDPSLAAQAASNVLTNAIRYTPEGGKLGVDVRRTGREVIIEIWDEGLGIPETQQHRVFDKFFRGDNVVLKETVGTGLGLYLTKTMLDLMGARIWFQSAEGRGSRFFLAFPTA